MSRTPTCTVKQVVQKTQHLRELSEDRDDRIGAAVLVGLLGSEVKANH